MERQADRQASGRSDEQTRKQTEGVARIQRTEHQVYDFRCASNARLEASFTEQALSNAMRLKIYIAPDPVNTSWGGTSKVTVLRSTFV